MNNYRRGPKSNGDRSIFDERPVDLPPSQQRKGPPPKLDSKIPSKCSPMQKLEDFKMADSVPGSRNFRPVKTLRDHKDGRPATLVELGALHKILNLLRPEDTESTSAWFSSEACCREIVERFQNLLHEWASDRERFDRCLAMDRALVRCENCGVIKCSERGEIGDNGVEKKFKHVTVERGTDTKPIDAGTNTRRSSKIDILGNGRSAIAQRHGPETPKREKVVANSALTPGRIPLKVTKNGAKNNLVNGGNYKLDLRDCAGQGRPGFEKLSRASHGQSGDASCAEKHPRTLETLQYLTRANLNATADPKSQDNSARAIKLLGHDPFVRGQKSVRRQSFDIHGSRDVDFHRQSDFFTTGETGLKAEGENADENRRGRKGGTVILESFAASLPSVDSSQRSGDGELKSRSSDTSSFGSWSAENLIHGWMKNACDSDSGQDFSGRTRGGSRENLPGARAASSSNNVPNIRARIAEAIKKFANHSALSDADLQRKPGSNGEKLSGLPVEESRVESTGNPEKDHSRSDGTKEEMELREISKSVSNTIWDEQNFLAPNDVVRNSTRVLSKTNGENSRSGLTVVSSERFDRQDRWIEKSELFERQILYDRVSSNDSSMPVHLSKIPPMYRKILESSEEMDWESFERLVTVLHPSQRELWSDICKAVSNEAKRVADETGATTEVCIEINPRSSGDKKMGIIRSRDGEITFELDMALHDVRAILDEGSKLEATGKNK